MGKCWTQKFSVMEGSGLIFQRGFGFPILELCLVERKTQSTPFIFEEKNFNIEKLKMYVFFSLF